MTPCNSAGAPDLPIGDGFAGHDEERGLGTTRVDL
jgi:hypothetical protein